MIPATKTKPLLLLLVVVAAATFPSTTRGLVARRPGPGAIGTGTGAGCVPQERDALLAFKRGITSDPAGQLASWQREGQEDQDCCRWRGVRCSNRTGHVLKLHLRNLRADECIEKNCVETALVGQISPSLLSLQHLEHLDLSLQKFQGSSTGRVPEFLGSFKNLRYLNLSCIPFSGSLPPQLGNLSKLNHLDLSQSIRVHLLDMEVPMYSTDISWLARLPLLRYLDMQFVDLRMVADWPHVVNMIPSLRFLYLSQCKLQSANYQSLPHLNLTNLEELDLSGNDIDQPIASCWFWNVTSLRYLGLRDTGMYGQFPSGLGDLKSLQMFVFSTNSMGSMTPIMRDLCNLEILDLSYSLLDENIRDILERLPRCSSNKLKELYLEDNNITGILPNWIGEFVNIAILDISGNKITGNVPPEIGGFNRLTGLDLSSNSFGGVITEEFFANLSSLEHIDLSHNSLKIAVNPEWQPPFRLESAFFASCEIGPMFPAWLKWQVDLSYLDISNAGIIDRLPEWFCNAFANITTLDISNNGISGKLPANMEIMTSLEELHLNSNQLTGQIPQLPTNLVSLEISRNSLSEPLPSNFGAPHIQYLHLDSNFITGRIPQSFCKLQGLVLLDLDNNLLEGELPQCFDPRNVKTLLLSNNRLSGMFPSFLRRCTDLSMLDLSWNKFSGRMPMWIGDFANLHILQLSHNMFSQSIPATITNLSSLFHLNLAGNSISGVIPLHLSNLTGLTIRGVAFFPPSSFNLSVITKGQELHYHDGFFNTMVTIDLSSNFLTGGIPEEIATLEAVINLNLSWNELSGKISDRIGLMQSLESLDLSRNKLYGEIPPSLSNLTYLSYLDLSYNNLRGRIPSGGQLDTLFVEHPSMYNGNSALCGPPLQKNCSSKHGDVQNKSERYSDPMFFYFGLVIGFVVGVWVVFCAMLFKKVWRIAYFRFFDKVYDKVYVRVVVTWARLVQKMATH